MDRSEFNKKEFPAQQRERLQLTLDTVRENQNEVQNLFCCLRHKLMKEARNILKRMYKQDRVAILLPNGILTEEQIAELGFDTDLESQEPASTQTI